jgi:hypothetical protein
MSESTNETIKSKRAFYAEAATWDRDQLFTPRLADGVENVWGAPSFDSERLELRASDYVLLASWSIVFTDFGPVEARLADCGLGCRCAAEIRPLTPAMSIYL